MTRGWCLGCGSGGLRLLVLRCVVPAALPASAAPAGPGSWDGVFFSNWEERLPAEDTEPATDEPDILTVEGGLIQLQEVQETENLVILGAGPAGLTAAIYAARANLRPLLISRDQGQLATTGVVENYPSCQASQFGESIIASFWQQARRFGARSLIAEVARVRLESEPYRLELAGGGDISFRGLIVATGAQSRRLEGTPGEERYYGRGVAGCATCEGWFFKGRAVAVVGGGDTAMEEALFLSRICKSVTIVHRRGAFSASKIMAERVLASQRITVKWNSTVAEFAGDGEKLTHVVVSNSWTELDEILEVEGAFVAIGQTPNTETLRGSPLDMDPDGFIRTHSGTRTNLEAVFAAGDVADRVYRQAITSAGTGAMAALDAERYLCHLGC